MDTKYQFDKNISFDQLLNFLIEIDHDFKPYLSKRIDLKDFAFKLLENAEIYALIDINEGNRIVAGIIVYKNDLTTFKAYIPVLGVVKDQRGKNLIKYITDKVEIDLRAEKFTSLALETWLGSNALPFYIKNGFYIVKKKKDRPENGVSITLEKELLLHKENLAFYPTPINKAINLSKELNINLWIKQDDLFMVPGGGSKARKLMHILSKAQNQGCNAIVTTGACQSNHLRASAIMARRLGMQMTAVIHDTKPKELTGNLKLLSLLNVKMVYIEMKDVNAIMNKEVEEFINTGFNPFYIWGGGHSLEGTYAYYKAVLELKKDWGKIAPDYIIIPSGTGTTQAGIEVGVRKHFPKCKVLGVSVARDEEKGKRIILDSANELISYLDNNIPKINDVFFDDTIMNKGYQDVFPELIESIEHAAISDGIVLDPTYSGKAFHGLKKYVNSGLIPNNANVIFWHTGGLLNLMASKHI